MYLYEIERMHEDERPWIFIVSGVDSEPKAHLTLIHHMWRDPVWSAMDSWFLDKLHNDIAPYTPPHILVNGFGFVHSMRGPSLVLLAQIIRQSPTPFSAAAEQEEVWSWASGDEEGGEWVDR